MQKEEVKSYMDKQANMALEYMRDTDVPHRDIIGMDVHRLVHTQVSPCSIS